MYDYEEYKNLTLKYGAYSSWAIWDYEKESNSSIIDQYFKQLHSKFVFIGLNIARPLTNKSWSNFHGGRHDRKLKYACNDNKLRGSYITDIFKNIPETKSTNLKKILTNKVIRKNVLFFNQEMKEIKINKSTQFILLGKLTAEYFNRYFKQNYKNRIFYYDHYSAYNKYTDKEWVTGLWKKLNISQNYDLITQKYK